MRIHTDTLTRSDIAIATTAAGSEVAYSIVEHRSRSRAHAYEVRLTGSGRRGGQWGNTDNRSATWDEWGMFLGELFRRDPDATIPGVYESAAHFRWATSCRFDDLSPADQHRNHRWQPSGTAASGAYYVHDCKTCDAERRIVASGHTWANVNGEV